MDSTLKYYNQNADQFVQGTLSVDFKQTQDRFLAKLPADAYILDFGCGSGRDTKYFLENGYQVDAADGSEELCKIASDYTGIKVKQMLFGELHDVDKYDGIWACSSILHLSMAIMAVIIFVVLAIACFLFIFLENITSPVAPFITHAQSAPSPIA